MADDGTSSWLKPFPYKLPSGEQGITIAPDAGLLVTGGRRVAGVPMGQPVVWEGSAFAQCLAEALADEVSSSQTAQAPQLLETVTPPDAAAARLLAGLEPECVDERGDEVDGSGSARRSGFWGGRWLGKAQQSVRAATVHAYVQQSKRLVQASKFGTRADQGLAAPPPIAGLTHISFSSGGHQESGMAEEQLACGWEREWLEHGKLAGGAGWLLSAAAAAVVPLHLVNSDRPRLAVAVGLTSLPVLAVAACRLHGTTADARLTSLVHRNLDTLGRSIDGLTMCAAA